MRQTTETEVINTTKAENDKRPPDFWEYIEALRPEECSRHIIYVYRWLDNGDLAGSTKVNVPIDIFGLKEIVGGGSFRLILKNGPQICRRLEKCIIEGRPKSIGDETHNAPANSNGGADNNAVNRLCNLLEAMIVERNGGGTMAEAMRGALALQADGFKSVVTNVREMNPAPGGGNNPFSDPVQFMNLLTMCKTLFAPAPANGVKDILDLVGALKQAGFVSGGDNGKVSLVQEALRLAPQVLGQIGQGLHEFAEAKKAEANAMAIAHGGRAAIPVAANPLPPANGVAPPTPISPAPPAAPGGTVDPRHLIQWIESKIADLVMDESLSASEAANEALAFLQTAAPEIMKQLLDAGEAGIFHVFNSEPALQRVPKNPRLTEFIKKFLELGNPPPNLSTNEAPKPA